MNGNSTDRYRVAVSGGRVFLVSDDNSVTKISPETPDHAIAIGTAMFKAAGYLIATTQFNQTKGNTDEEAQTEASVSVRQGT